MLARTWGCTRPGKPTKNYGKIHHFQWEKSLFLWQFSIAMLNYQRVTITSRDIIQPSSCSISSRKKIEKGMYMTTYSPTQDAYMEVSWNRGTPKSSIFMGFSIINNPAMGISHLWKPPCIYNQRICFFQRKPTEINPWHSRWGLEDQTFDLGLFAFFWLGNISPKSPSRQIRW